MMLSVAMPESGFVWQLVLTLGLVASIGANVVVIFSVRSKQRREVSFTFTPASKEEFDRHVIDDKREHENLFSKIGGVERGTMARMDSISGEWRRFAEAGMREIVQSNNQGREKLHDRINEILREVSEIRGELKGKSKT